MLTYNETLGKILSLERSIKHIEESVTSSPEQLEYRDHCKRVLQEYIKEHRRAARRENEYALR